MRRRQVLQSLLAASLLPSVQANRTALLQRQIPGRQEYLPAVGLGTWQAFDIEPEGEDAAAARLALQQLLDSGGRVVDTSPMYGRAEAALGALTATQGDKLFMATKIWISGAQAGQQQLAQSFQRLARQRLDLVQVHNLLDTSAHLKTLAAEREAGRVRYIGLTHYRAAAHAELMRWMRKEPVDFIQINYSILEPEAAQEVLPLAAERGIAVLINRPFAEGALLKTVRERKLPEWVRSELGCSSWAQCFLKWILAEPAVTCVLAGTRKAAHVADNLGAATGVLPDRRQRALIAQLVA